MTPSSVHENTLQTILIRNAFLAGVCSTSLLWGVVTWSMHKIGKRQQHRRALLCTEEEEQQQQDEDENDMLRDNDGNESMRTEMTNGSNINIPLEGIPTDISTTSSSSAFPHNYNPWGKTEEATIQYKQLLELRTALIEQSKRTSLMLLDKILSQTKRIGELPSARKRIRWPWESLRKHLNEGSINSMDDGNKDPSDDIGYNTNSSTSDNNKDLSSPIQIHGFPSQVSSSVASHASASASMAEDCRMNGAGGMFGSSFSEESHNIIGDHHHQSLHKAPSNASKSFQTASSAETTKADICIGSIFGLDVGGTLSKLVYFEMKKENVDKNNNINNRRSSGSNNNLMGVPRAHSSRAINTSLSHSPVRKSADAFAEMSDGSLLNNQSMGMGRSYPLRRGHSSSCEYSMDDISFESSWPQQEPPIVEEKKPLKRSHSLFDIRSKKEKEEQALERFYEFARRLDTYDSEVKDKSLSFYSRALGGEFHFIQFETRHLSQAMDLIKFNDLHLDISRMGATGGGAHKYADEWERYLGIEIAKQDELDSLVAGMQFTLADVVGECYTFKPPPLSERSNSTSTEKSNKDSESQKSVPKYKIDQYWWSRKVKRDFIAKSDSYPYLLVMIGTGVSVLRVDGPRKHERISGSTIGGGTYWGLCRLLTDVEDFESVLSLAERGDPSKVDMMVGDIYGKESDALDKLGLTADIVASSFGKLVAKTNPAEGLRQEDLARALLLMVTNNIGQVAYLNAQLHNTKRIYFVGNFLRHNNLSQRRLAYAINYWSRGKMEALFLEHEGYYGALGSFLLHQGISNDRDGKVAQSKDGPVSDRSHGKIRKRDRKQRSMSL